MRKRTPKFALEFAEGAEIQTMAELREKFDLKACIKYLEDDQLARWLADRLYEDEAAEVRALDVQDKNLARELCKIFGVDYDLVSEQLDDEETIAWRKERRERLKKFTNDATILKRVDDVAFDQDDLIDILRDENIPATIYLCGEEFIFPSGALKKQNITYIGVGDKVTVKIDTQNPVDFAALKISFQNVSVNNFRLDLILANNIDTSNSNAYKIVKFAAKFQSKIKLVTNGESVVINENNIFDMNHLGLKKGAFVTIIADGSDADDAFKALINFMTNDLD